MFGVGQYGTREFGQAPVLSTGNGLGTVSPFAIRLTSQVQALNLTSTVDILRLRSEVSIQKVSDNKEY